MQLLKGLRCRKSETDTAVRKTRKFMVQNF